MAVSIKLFSIRNLKIEFRRHLIIMIIILSIQGNSISYFNLAAIKRSSVIKRIKTKTYKNSKAYSP